MPFNRDLEWGEVPLCFCFWEGRVFAMTDGGLEEVSGLRSARDGQIILAMTFGGELEIMRRLD